MPVNVPATEIQDHVARIAGSSSFGSSDRLRELLKHTVAESLAGRGASLKESVLGVTVFGRKPGYDSGANSIVRVEFARLRRKLQQYYESEGASEPLRITFPKGSYVPEFERTGTLAEAAFAGSVVVLPFICLGSDPDDEYFADGLTDELITALTRVPGLKVVARTSSFTFKGRADDIRGIGATLHVDTAIEGSLRRQGDLLRIHVQLVSIRDGCNIWAAKYERRMAGSGSYEGAPIWSPDSKVLYFSSEREGIVEQQAVRLNPDARRPLGEPFAVAAFHSTRRKFGRTSGYAVTKDWIVWAVLETTSNLFLMNRVDPSENR